MSDLLMWVGAGKAYPWPNDFTEEAMRVGVSKRVARTAIPEIEPGVSRLALIHPKAIVKVTAELLMLTDLAVELTTEFVEPYASGGIWPQGIVEFVESELCFEGQSMSGLTFLLREAERANDLERIEKKYGIEYQAGVFGWAPLSGIHYVLRDKEMDLPEDLDDVIGIKAVVMDYNYSEEKNDE